MDNSMDIVFSFDDTGSMSAIRHQVRACIRDTYNTLKKVIPNLRVGVCIHNDYGDVDCYHQFPLTANFDELEKALSKQVRPGGFGAQAAYELPLHNLHTTFNWESDKRVAVIIGDEVPNKVGMIRHIHRNDYDWKEEVKSCAAQGIKIYGVHALGQARTRPFYETMARMTGGVKLDLAQFAHINYYLTAVAYSVYGKLDEFEASRDEFKTNLALRNMFSHLRGNGSVVNDGQLDLLGRFQVMDVPARIKIKDFVESNGAQYKAGRGFYQLVKSETIQDYKELIAVNKATGEVMSTQVDVRTLLGLPIGSTVDFNPRHSNACHHWDIYVQSTSYTRKLDAGTKFLYELNHT